MKNKTHSHADRGLDIYETPKSAVRALLDAERLPTMTVWEPACASGNIVSVLIERGYVVTASDINREDLWKGGFQADFLAETQSAAGTIVTNPPFKDAEKFVRHALDLCDNVFMLLRLAFLESMRRSDILDSGQLKRVLVFKNRLPMMHRKGWEGPKSSSTMAFAWFIWDKNYNGPIEVKRIVANE